MIKVSRVLKEELEFMPVMEKWVSLGLKYVDIKILEPMCYSHDSL